MANLFLGISFLFVAMCIFYLAEGYNDISHNSAVENNHQSYNLNLSQPHSSKFATPIINSSASAAPAFQCSTAAAAAAAAGGGGGGGGSGGGGGGGGGGAAAATSTSSSSCCSSCLTSSTHKPAFENVFKSENRKESSPFFGTEEMFDHLVHFNINQAKKFQNLLYSYQKPDYKSMAYSNCMELLEDTLDQLSNAMNRNKKLTYTRNDVQTWLSAALTNQETCIESLQRVKKEEVISMAKNLSTHISNSLSNYVSQYMKQDKSNNNRKLLSHKSFPDWLSRFDRNLLQTPTTELKANAVVAKDGSGTHTTITKAIETVPSNFIENGRYVIYVKAGTYDEIINIPTKMKNIMLIGDGKENTFIVGSRNANDGWSAFQSATVGVMGDGFIAKGITFINNAGPNKHQAVALRVGSDKSVIYGCSIQGHHNSLYTHSKRQFFRESDIYGTVDFITGNSAVVFQNCNIYAKNLMQDSFITAQGRTDPNQNTGISIHNCTIFGGSAHSTYLGRPWKQYSRIVVMQSFLDQSINPIGWYSPSNNSALSTIYHSEYMNRGPGSSNRGNLTAADARVFTVGKFIDGDMWLPDTGVPYASELLV